MECTVTADTDLGRIEWVDGVLKAPAAALQRLHKADPDGLYGPCPPVTIEDAYKYPFPFADLVRRVFPDAQVVVSGFADDDEEEGLIY